MNEHEFDALVSAYGEAARHATVMGIDATHGHASGQDAREADAAEEDAREKIVAAFKADVAVLRDDSTNLRKAVRLLKKERQELREDYGRDQVKLGEARSWAAALEEECEQRRELCRWFANREAALREAVTAALAGEPPKARVAK